MPKEATLAVATAAGRLGISPYNELMRVKLQPNWVEAEINSYLDSQEYRDNFGDNVVPSYAS